MRSIFFLFTCVLAAVTATELTDANFDELTTGKTVFIKFQAPWWGHCKSMKADWQKLMDHDDVKAMEGALVGDMDCTVHKDTCAKVGVEGYPTIKHGSVDNLQDYKGGRTFDDLLSFAKENMGPSCSPNSKESCNAEELKVLEKAVQFSAGKLDAKIRKAEAKIETAEADFKEKIAKLQGEYESLSKAKDAAVKAVKDSGLAILKSAKAFKAKK